MFAPDQLDHAVQWDHLAGLQEQNGEQAPALTATQLDGLFVMPSTHRSQHRELHPPTVVQANAFGTAEWGLALLAVGESREGAAAHAMKGAFGTWAMP